MNYLTGSKLIELLTDFTRTEWRDFRPFIVSAVAGAPGKSLQLYDYLAPHYPGFPDPHLERTKVFRELFGKQNYEDKKLRYAFTDLYRQACAFLKFRELENQPDEGRHLLASRLARNGADKSYLSLYRSDDASPPGDAGGQAEIYFNRYRLHYVHLNHFVPRQLRKMENPIGEVARNLDIFFVAKKMQLLCEVVNVQNVMSVNYDFMLRDEIMQLLNKGAFSDIPLISIYYRIYMTLTEPGDEGHFELLRSLLLQHENLFKKGELRDMYQYLMNYCIKKINLGVVKYIPVLLAIYKTITGNKVIYTDGHISQWDFKNIVVIGLRADEQAWVLDFIEKYKSELRDSERNNAYVYNLAYYYFSIGDYRNTLSLLSKVEFTDLYYQLDMRAILLKCYYETDDQDAFYYHIAAFRIFLSRNRMVSEYQRTIYRNLIKYATALVRAGSNRKKLEQLKIEIEEVKQIADINWVRKKLVIP